MKKLTSLLGNSQRLDGGAMFGNAPKALWSRWVESDENNQIALSCRCLLIQDEGRNILLEAGIGAFFPPELAKRYGIVEQRHCLLDSLSGVGLDHKDIDIVVLSHLHFDHAGGLLSAWQDGEFAELLFPNARFIVSERAWQRAKNPHPRDKASFVKDITTLLELSGRLELVDSNTSPLLGAEYRFHMSHGHTPGMLLTEVTMPDGPIVFAADLVPGVPWVHLPITMGYDRFPEALIDEKQALLTDLQERKGRLFFTHDNDVALARLSVDAACRFSVDNAKNDLFQLVN